MKTLDDAPFLDVFDPVHVADPAAAVERLRPTTWLVRTPIGGLVIGRPQVQALLADRHLRSSITDIARLQGVTEGELHERLGRTLLALEGDEHTRIRRLVSRSFTPRAVDAHRPQMRAVLDELVAPLVDTDRCDLMDAVADHYPIRVMCHVLGVPEEDHEEFAAWNRALTWALSFELGSHLDEVAWGMAQMDAYVTELMEDRRRVARDDLVTDLLQARDADDRLSDDEILTLIASLLFAGYDTTRNQLGLAVWLFAAHPDQWALLADDPALAPRAVEEVMRFRGAVSVAPRVVAEAFEFEGYRFEAGTVLALSTAAANKDPDAYREPYVFDITADREPQLTFGGGPHYCLGASLARAELQEALPRLARAMPDLALEGEPSWRPPIGIFGPDTLPVRFAGPAVVR